MTFRCTRPSGWCPAADRRASTECAAAALSVVVLDPGGTWGVVGARPAPARPPRGGRPRGRVGLYDAQLRRHAGCPAGRSRAGVRRVGRRCSGSRGRRRARGLPGQGSRRGRRPPHGRPLRAVAHHPGRPTFRFTEGRVGLRATAVILVGDEGWSDRRDLQGQRASASVRADRMQPFGRGRAVVGRALAGRAADRGGHRVQFSAGRPPTALPDHHQVPFGVVRWRPSLCRIPGELRRRIPANHCVRATEGREGMRQGDVLVTKARSRRLRRGGRPRDRTSLTEFRRGRRGGLSRRTASSTGQHDPDALSALDACRRGQRGSCRDVRRRGP
jgi:hypothetical protein